MDKENTPALYIMRHGMTDWNIRHKLQGHTDIPLNEKGRQMAREAGKKYADIHFDVCYCSPLQRARETAALFLEDTATPIVCDERLIEMSFGIYEGEENTFERPDCPINALYRTPEQYRPDGGVESFAQLYARTGEFLQKVAYPAMQEGKTVLIVGHGAMNLSIICQVRNIPLADFWKMGIENCRLIKLICNDLLSSTN